MTNEATNFVSNSELEKYLRTRKEAQTEVEIKNIMGRIYKCIAENSKLIHAFTYTIPPILNDDGTKSLHPDAMVELALIYSETEAAYLPVYTNVEESKNRGNIEKFPELAQCDFDGYYDIVFSENSVLHGIVINPYTDNLVLSKSRIEHLMNVKKKQAEEKEQSSTVSSISLETEKKNYISDIDLQIADCTSLSTETINTITKFAEKHDAIDAIWIFDKKYYRENDGTKHNATLFVIQDNQGVEERGKMYSDLKEMLNSYSEFSEIHIEVLGIQRNDFVRKNGILPFYQRINICGIKTKEENILLEESVVESENEKIKEDGWNAIENEFLRIYPEQVNPKHYGALIKWKFGGPDPLDGISVYDAGDHWHFVTFGLSELYEKESENKEISGFGLEFTYKLKKGCYADEESEIKATCALLQQIAKIIVVDKEIIKSYEYLYTGQEDGIDSVGESKITGFITISDPVVEMLNTPNGKLEFVELIGVTDNELKAIMNKECKVKELYERLGTDITDYKRESII